MIIYGNNRSRKKPKRKTAKQVAEYNSWLGNVKSMTLGLKVERLPKVAKSYIMDVPVIPEHRNLNRIPSLKSTDSYTTMKPRQYYTGDKMIGIGTLHKSNAVPIFDPEDAKDQAKMRR